MLKTLMLACLVGPLVAAMPMTVAAAAPRHHVRVAPRYVPGQIYNYRTLRRPPCWWRKAAGWNHGWS